MTLLMQVLKAEPNSLKTKSISVLVRNGDVVRQAEVILPLNAELESIDPQLAWDKGSPIEDPLRQWHAYQLRNSDETFSQVIAALLDQLRSGGTLADMVAAARAALAQDSGQLTALNRLTTVFKAATPAQQAEFVALMALLSSGKLGKK
jgi:hypothetical protein